MELTEFITARLDEDETTATVAILDNWEAGGEEVKAKSADPFWDGTHIADTVPANARHIARHDPARVLREVAAKRAIVGDENEGLAMIAVHERGTWPEELTREADRVLRRLAAVWSDHPDYRQEWAPERRLPGEPLG